MQSGIGMRNLAWGSADGHPNIRGNAWALGDGGILGFERKFRAQGDQW